MRRIARGWDEAAQGYEAYFVPRFAPWVAEAVEAVISSRLPDGPILVPCCGTFPELPMLAEHLAGREIIGIDLSASMAGIARARAAQWSRVSVVQGDAADLDPQWTGRCAAVVSVFGLQQLPDPIQALRGWAATLRPGGRLSVMYWPETTDTDGPFAHISRVVRPHVPPSDRSWERALAATLTAAGLTIERDDHVTHPISHPDAATFFHAYTRYGPMRPFTTGHTEAFMTDLRRQFLATAPTGEWTHHPRARHLIATA